MRTLTLATLMLLAPLCVARGGETLALTTQPCTKCAGKGYTESWPLCPACEASCRDLYVAAKRELTKGGRDREDVAAIVKLARSRLPKCKTCDAVKRTKSKCSECDGRGELLFLANGTRLAPDTLPDNERSAAIKREQKIRALNVEIRSLEEQLAVARRRLEELTGAEPPASEAAPPPDPTPVEANPRERVSVPRESF